MHFVSSARAAFAAACLASVALPAMASDWSGFYVGGGASFRKHKVDFPNGMDRVIMDDTTAPGIRHFEKTPDLSHEGNTVDGHVLGGYLFQKDRFVFGAEADYEIGSSFSDGRTPGIPACANEPVFTTGHFGCVGLSTFFDDVKTLGHVRGIAGVEITPSLLGFVAGGLAIGKSPETIGASAGGMMASPPSTPLIGAATVQRSNMAETIYGWTIGGGLQVKVGHGFRLRGEYMYDKYKGHDIAVGGAGFGGTIGELTTNSFTSPGNRVDYSSHTVRLAAIYSFSETDDPAEQPDYLKSDWSGAYFGGGLSMSRHKVGFPDATNFLNMTNNVTQGSLRVEPSNEFEGDSTGGHLLAGYQHQFGRFIFGAEGDVELNNVFDHPRGPGGPACLTQLINFQQLGSGHAECIGTQLIFSDVKSLGHVRLKAGYEVTPALMAFVSGGLAIGRSPDQIGAGAFGFVANSPSSPLLGAATVLRSNMAETVYGASIGGGLEMKVSENLRLRGEYLYDKYKSLDIAVGGAGFGGTIGDITTNSFVSPGTKVDMSNQTVRLTAIYQF
ncbi:outer membrane beta-barrel protein [Mesorhizobium abyssinicae]|uniref:Outer membrane beta-barrel protein n=2 Tax=Mesorhizobium abyssinicae TaxID=1209958 RepID=A0ABU5ATL3_9HYPH|nr:outer membrane beta-barrel protein [Mesorhizobium abyssinicae]MDX8540529.1 outer membrane beta-barrel protein [Mesorhizobium abyssinicae]